MKMNIQIGAVLSAAFYNHIRSLIQCIDDFLLNALVQGVIQGVDGDGLIKNSFELFSNLRHRESNDGKTSLLPRNIGIGDLSCLGCIFNAQLLLFFGISRRCLLCHRFKIFFSEYFLHGRTAKGLGHSFVTLIAGFQTFQLTVHQLSI